MTISREVARNQIARLGCLAFPPSTDEGLAELITTLQDKARSERHARAVVNAILENPGEDRRWPTPDQIRSVAWGLLSDEDKAAKHCEACNGTGWIQTWRGEYSGVKRCVCNPKAEAPAEPAKVKANK